MDGSLAPRPITPGLRPHRVAAANRDPKDKKRSFHDEMADEHEPPEHAEEHDEVDLSHASPDASDTAAPRPAPPPPARGHKLDIEA